MPRVIESMTKIKIKGRNHNRDRTLYKIRIWRNEEIVRSRYDNTDLKEKARKSYEDSFGDIVYVVEKLSDMDRVNAIECLDTEGEGVLIYPNWP